MYLSHYEQVLQKSVHRALSFFSLSTLVYGKTAGNLYWLYWKSWWYYNWFISCTIQYLQRRWHPWRCQFHEPCQWTTISKKLSCRNVFQRHNTEYCGQREVMGRCVMYIEGRLLLWPYLPCLPKRAGYVPILSKKSMSDVTLTVQRYCPETQ